MLLKRGILIGLSFLCFMSVILLGNRFILRFDLSDIDKLSELENVYHQYEIWEIEQMQAYPNYENLVMLIDIDRKTLYVVDQDKNEVIKKYYVATGKAQTPTPTGTFKIIQKARWGGGFGSRWMKLNVPWGQYGIHGTNKPSSIGYDASHGCIRMRNKDIEELFGLVKYNTTVVIYKGRFGPFGHGFRILRPGARGEDVKEVQRRLKQKGYYHGSLDGIYGNGMKVALIKFLKDNSIPITDKVGYSIYRALGISLME